MSVIHARDFLTMHYNFPPKPMTYGRGGGGGGGGLSYRIADYSIIGTTLGNTPSFHRLLAHSKIELAHTGTSETLYNIVILWEIFLRCTNNNGPG